MRIAGVDEAGRGPLAGPVTACACILPPDFSHLYALKDSKQLTAKEREYLYQVLTTDPNVFYAVHSVSEEIIDSINILQATLLAMKQAVESLPVTPDLVLVDGRQIPSISCPAQAIVRGDALHPCISAASIIAKVTRDHYVAEYDSKWPTWRFSVHKGYGTKYHLQMIRQHGILPIHRKSFEPIKSFVYTI